MKCVLCDLNDVLDYNGGFLHSNFCKKCKLKNTQIINMHFSIFLNYNFLIDLKYRDQIKYFKEFYLKININYFP